MAASRSQQGTPGKSGPAIFAFLCPKPPLGSFTKAIGLGSSMPSWRSGKHSRVLRHRRAFADCFGANSVASALGSSTRRDPGAADRTYHGWPRRPLKTGTFYFARKRNFLLCLDTGSRAIRKLARLGDRPLAADVARLLLPGVYPSDPYEGTVALPDKRGDRAVDRPRGHGICGRTYESLYYGRTTIPA